MPKLTEQIILRLLKGRGYPSFPSGHVVLFGLRGWRPVNNSGTNISNSVSILESQLDYRTVNCSIGIWKVGKGIGIYPGSTVPQGSSVQLHSNAPFGKVNQMVPGCYASYKLGDHGGGIAHRAVRQVRAVVVRRSDDGNATYDLTDPIYVDTAGYKENGVVFANPDSIVHDNIHCGRNFEGESLIPDTLYSSLGCQVVAGTTQGPASTERGPWRKFVRRLYNNEDYRQNNYTYILFSQDEVSRSLIPEWRDSIVETTFGSYNQCAKAVQHALFERGFYAGNIDGDFRKMSVSALLAFETTTFGSASGRVTPEASEKLGLEPLTARNVSLVEFGSLEIDPEPEVHTDALNDQIEPIIPSSEEFVTPISIDDENLAEDDSLLARIDVSYDPLPGWKVSLMPGSQDRWELIHSGLNSPFYLGRSFTYTPSSPDTTGLARTSGASPKLPFEPTDYSNGFGNWPELLFPTSYAESNANFLVVNAWDNAAITFGFIQLAAHTGSDLIPFFRRLAVRLPDEMKQWFPELAIVDGEISFVEGGRYKSLERKSPPNDGATVKSYYRGDFMQFFNPSRLRTDLEEAHATARWCEWSRQSESMRNEQVSASIENMIDSVEILHEALLKNGSHKYPRGVDGMRCDHLAAAIAVPHLSPAKVDRAVYALLRNDVLGAFETIEYGPGDRERNVVYGVRSRGERLSRLRYDLSSHTPLAH